MSHVLSPPYVELGWSPTAFSTAFQAYRVYRRPARAPIAPWSLIAEIGVPAVGSSATVIEAQHTAFRDYQLGWYQDAGGQWADGFDYAITVKKTNGLESLYGTIMARNVVPAAGNPWVVCNTAPWLNSPLEAVEGVKSNSNAGKIVRRYQGRDLSVVRTPKELAGRSVDSKGHYFAVATPDQLRYLRALEASGRQASLCRTRGDIITGDLTVPSFADAPGVRQEIALHLEETDRAPALADYNLPPGVVLNGSSQYATTPDNALLNPGAGPFTMIVAAAFSGANGRYAISKWDGVSSQVYGIYTPSSNTLSAYFGGASAAADVIDTGDVVWFDGNVHVAVATTTGSAQAFYRDGTLVRSLGVTTGAISNPGPFQAGALNSVVSMALSPVRAWAVYQRALTAAEALAASYYLLGYPGYRMPAGASAFFDVRDDRCNVGTGALQGLAGNGLTASLVGSPPKRGYARAMKQLEAF